MVNVVDTFFGESYCCFYNIVSRSLGLIHQVVRC